MTPSWFPDTLLPDIWLRRAQAPAALLDNPPAPPDAEGLIQLDLRITGGRIAAIAPAGTAKEGIDLDRGQLWPCFVDGHVHLDKTQTWPRRPNPDGTHAGAKNAVIADRGKHYAEDDIQPRFEFGLRCALAHGTAAMRTHLDSYWPDAKAHWAVFRRLREAWAGRIDLQAVSICPLERFAGDDGVSLANEVAASGRHPRHDHHGRRGTCVIASIPGNARPLFQPRRGAWSRARPASR